MCSNMDYSNFNISQKQAKDFAKAIFADILIYVETHRKEYEMFLQDEYNLDIQEIH